MKWEQIIEKLQNMGKDRFALLFLAGVMLIIIAMPLGKENAGTTEENKAETEQAQELADSEQNVMAKETDIEEYRARLCSQLEDFLQQMDGVGKVKVYITMHSSSELIVERNSSYTKRTEEEVSQESTRTVGETENDSQVVLVEQEDGSEAPFVVKEMAPVVRGVVVAAQGGGDETIKKEITSLVMALFGIEEHKIRVVKLTT